MSVVTEAHAAAEAVSQAVRNGAGLRASMSGLSWAQYAPYSIAANGATFTKSESRHYTLLEVLPKDPASKVAEKGAKPEVAVATQSEIAMAKYAGYSRVSLECLTYTTEAERIITDVVLNQVVQALDADLVAAMLAKNTAITTTAKGSAAILEAQAGLIALGGIPNSIFVNPADYAGLLSQTANGQYLNFANAELGSRGLLFGMALVPTAKVPKGTAYLVDSRGVLVAEHSESPMLFVSPVSDGTTNEFNLIVDLFAAVGVASSGAVAKVPLTF